MIVRYEQGFGARPNGWGCSRPESLAPAGFFTVTNKEIANTLNETADLMGIAGILFGSRGQGRQF
jgi:hypothetical protein